MNDIRPCVSAASLRLFDPLRLHRCAGGYAWKAAFYTHVLGRGAMGVLSPLDGE
jgi:hypothetical protein